MKRLFDRELWVEIYHSISANKLRTALTAVGVFWGIFMLILLLGAGRGLSNATLEIFSASATNAIYVWPQRSSIPFQGLQAGRRFYLNTSDIESLRNEVDGMEYIAPRVQLGEVQVEHNSETNSLNVHGELPDMFAVESLDIIEGRKLNAKDIIDRRRVAVIGKDIGAKLNAQQSLLGKYIRIQKKDFLVVGVYNQSSTIGRRGGLPNENIYIPLPVSQSFLPIPDMFHWFVCTVDPSLNIKDVESNIKSVLRRKHRIHPEDKLAIGSWNKGDFFNKFQSMFSGINLFIWIVGIGSLIAGIVGVGNVMLISVKERTQEIGLRKALGATPRSLIEMILLESLVITFLAGYLGLICGVGLLSIIEFFMTTFGAESSYFKRPEISFSTGILSLVLIVISGLIAGLYPANHAARMNPVEALRNE